jgi:hypothetical protein
LPSIMTTGIGRGWSAVRRPRFLRVSWRCCHAWLGRASLRLLVCHATTITVSSLPWEWT